MKISRRDAVKTLVCLPLLSSMSLRSSPEAGSYVGVVDHIPLLLLHRSLSTFLTNDLFVFGFGWKRLYQSSGTCQYEVRFILDKRPYNQFYTLLQEPDKDKLLQFLNKLSLERE